MKLLKKIYTIFLIFILMLSIVQSNIKDIEASGLSPTSFIVILSQKKKGNKITIKYKVNRVPMQGIAVEVGLEYPTQYRVHNNYVLVTKKGTFSKTFTMKTCGFVRIYTKISARGYSSKKKYNIYHDIPTKTIAHTVTKSEAKADSYLKIAIGVGLTLFTPGGKAASIICKIVGVGFTVTSGLAYSPRVGDYMVVTTSLNANTKRYIVLIKIYKDKKTFQKKKKPSYTYKNTFEIPGF